MPTRTRFLIAPQSFKGSLTATEAARAMADGVRRLLPGASITVLPLADGGEGTVEAIVTATGGRPVRTRVTGPLGGAVTATWGISGDGRTAIIEMAAASGITLVPPARLDPRRATTYGTGELIRAALDAGCRRFIIGLGGSATNDGGAGMAQALGARLLDSEGQDLPFGGAALARLKCIDTARMDRRLPDCSFQAACDVSNPLCGPSGASHVYGPQKGATPDICHELDQALENYAAVLRRDLRVEVRHLPGAGAAGGLGAGLVAFLGAELRPGFDIVAEAVGLSRLLADAEIVLTGEGRLDRQTFFGKVVAGVAARARALGLPVLAIAGRVEVSGPELAAAGISAAASLCRADLTEDQAMKQAARLLTATTAHTLASFFQAHSPSAEDGPH